MELENPVGKILINWSVSSHHEEENGSIEGHRYDVQITKPKQCNPSDK